MCDVSVPRLSRWSNPIRLFRESELSERRPQAGARSAKPKVSDRNSPSHGEADVPHQTSHGGRNPDEDDRRFAYRCMMQAHRMMKQSQPKRRIGNG